MTKTYSVVPARQPQPLSESGVQAAMMAYHAALNDRVSAAAQWPWPELPESRKAELEIGIRAAIAAYLRMTAGRPA